MASIELEHVVKEFGDLTAVDDVSLNISDGELVVIVGPSGSGKSTLLRIISGLTAPTSATIRFNDRDVTESPPEDRNVSMVFQDLALYPHMTAFENIAFPLKAHDKPSREEIEERVRRAAELVSADHLLEQDIPSLSGGEQQRVALARALIREPEVFLMDEPFSDLDELLKRQLRSAVLRLQKQLDITMVHVTHDQEEAMTMGDRIVVMNQGDIMQVGEPKTVYDDPENLFVATFIGSPQMNYVECRVGEVTRDSVTLVNDGLTFALNGRYPDLVENARSDRLTLCVRPEYLSWADDRPAEDGHITFPVTSDVIETVGTEDVVHCLTANDEEVTIVVPSGTVGEDEEGYIYADLSNVLLFDGEDGTAPRLN